jgi:hypothetical protein
MKQLQVREACMWDLEMMNNTNKTAGGTDDRCIERIMFLWAMIAFLQASLYMNDHCTPRASSHKQPSRSRETSFSPPSCSSPQRIWRPGARHCTSNSQLCEQLHRVFLQ